LRRGRNGADARSSTPPKRTRPIRQRPPIGPSRAGASRVGAGHIGPVDPLGRSRRGLRAGGGLSRRLRRLGGWCGFGSACFRLVCFGSVRFRPGRFRKRAGHGSRRRLRHRLAGRQFWTGLEPAVPALGTAHGAAVHTDRAVGNDITRRAGGTGDDHETGLSMVPP
jgi:hypothetical protein